jgi:sec-independent protein translocase protein TatB
MGAHPPILLGTLGMWDSLILMVLALVVFGPRRLPQIGRQVGKLMYEFRKASNDFKFQMEEELRNAEEADRRKKEEERQRSLAASVAAEQASVSADPPAPARSVESPYPDDQTAPGAAPAEESMPRIQPPTTGETVAAARPTRIEETPQQMPGGENGSTSGANSEPAPSSEQKPTQTPMTAEALNQHG